jgi:hypothetical protein
VVVWLHHVGQIGAIKGGKALVSFENDGNAVSTTLALSPRRHRFPNSVNLGDSLGKQMGASNK